MIQPGRSLFAFLLCLALALGSAAQTRVEMVISSPVDGETVHDNDGNVRVTVAIQGLQADAVPGVRALVDGKPHGPDRQAPTFVLEDLDRGEHVLQVLLVDPRGELVAQSPPVAFYLWRASANFPARRN